MANIAQSLYNMRYLDELACGRTIVHKLHPLIKLIVTIVYLIMLVSFDRYEVSRLIPFVFYPVVIMAMAELPVVPVLKRVLVVEPLVIGIGILNPVFDHKLIEVAGVQVSSGWITFLSIFLKCSLAVTAAIILIATTGMDRIAQALRILRVPRMFVLQLMLTYRYIGVLLEEAGRIYNAYMLRAPGHKGISFKAWGSLAGQMLMRTYDRAQRVYQAMRLRGFNGEYNHEEAKKTGNGDYIYLACWVMFFAAGRYFDIPALIGATITGVIR